MYWIWAAAIHALSDLDLPEDNGQHWSEYAYEFMPCIQQYLAESPSIILTNHVREYGFGVQFKLAEKFLTVMDTSGIDTGTGMTIFNMLGSIAFGAAVEEIRHRDFDMQAEGVAGAAKSQLSRLDQSERPLFSRSIERFTVVPGDKIKTLLRAAFRSVARDLGEDEKAVLPD